MSDATPAAVLTVDLGAIAANYRRLKEYVAPAECAAVVKADAYGLGMAAVAPALARAGALSFFVAQLAEGMALRRVLPKAAQIYGRVAEEFAAQEAVLDQLQEHRHGKSG